MTRVSGLLKFASIFREAAAHCRGSNFSTLDLKQFKSLEKLIDVLLKVQLVDSKYCHRVSTQSSTHPKDVFMEFIFFLAAQGQSLSS